MIAVAAVSRLLLLVLFRPILLLRLLVLPLLLLLLLLLLPWLLVREGYSAISIMWMGVFPRMNAL